MENQVTVYKDTNDFRRAVDALHKQHIENGEAITREEVEKHAWKFLERAVWELEENLADVIEYRGSYHFDMDYYQPKEFDTDVRPFTLETAKEVAQRRTDMLGWAHKVVYAESIDWRTQARSMSYFVLDIESDHIQGETVFTAEPAHA
jgi:hypothetical protein